MRISNYLLKKLTVLALVGGFSLAASHANAADDSTIPTDTTNWVAKVSERLGLSDDQKAKVEPILKDSFEKRRAVLEKYKGQRSLKALRSARKELEPIKEETDTQLKGVLTKDQMKELEKIRSEMKKELREKIKERRSQSD